MVKKFGLLFFITLILLSSSCVPKTPIQKIHSLTLAALKQYKALVLGLGWAIAMGLGHEALAPRLEKEVGPTLRSIILAVLGGLSLYFHEKATEEFLCSSENDKETNQAIWIASKGALGGSLGVCGNITWGLLALLL